MKTGWFLRKDWTIWNFFIFLILSANIGVAGAYYWMGDFLLANTHSILAGLLVLLERD